VFLAVRRDPQRHDQAVLADVDAVEDQPDQVEALERLRLPGFQLRARLRDKPPAHGALARTARRHRRRQQLEAATVLPRRDTDEHLFDNPSIQRILAGHELKRGQRHLRAVATDPGPANRDLAAAEDDFTRHRPRARSSPTSLMLISRTADRRAILFEHRGQHLQPGADGELQQLRPRIHEEIDER